MHLYCNAILKPLYCICDVLFEKKLVLFIQDINNLMLLLHLMIINTLVQTTTRLQDDSLLPQEGSEDLRLLISA